MQDAEQVGKRAPVLKILTVSPEIPDRWIDTAEPAGRAGSCSVPVITSVSGGF